MSAALFFRDGVPLFQGRRKGVVVADVEERSVAAVWLDVLPDLWQTSPLLCLLCSGSLKGD